MTDHQHPVQQDNDGIVTLTLVDPGASALVLSKDLITRIDEALDRIEAMPGVTGLILASGCSRVYIAGANLHEIDGLDDPGLDAYLQLGTRVFGRLATLPYPTVAAIDGAALGGGLEIAMHCDGLVGLRTEKPFPVGLPEAGLDICPGWGGTQLLPARIDPAAALEQTGVGRPMKSDQAAEAGLFDAMADGPDALIDCARAYLKEAASSAAVQARIARRRPHCISDVGDTESMQAAHARAESALPDTQAARAVLDAFATGLREGFEAGVGLERASLIRLRHTPEAKEKLEAFFNKSRKPASKS
jgi:enoyl-CoA hydratase/carnithine racemase